MMVCSWTLNGILVSSLPLDITTKKNLRELHELLVVASSDEVAVVWFQAAVDEGSDVWNVCFVGGRDFGQGNVGEVQGIPLRFEEFEEALLWAGGVTKEFLECCLQDKLQDVVSACKPGVVSEGVPEGWYRLLCVLHCSRPLCRILLLHKDNSKSVYLLEDTQVK